MSGDRAGIEVESIPLAEASEQLRQTHPFAEVDFAALGAVSRVERVRAEAGAVLVEAGEPARFYWLVVNGEIRAERPEPDGSRTAVGIARIGEGFGEAPLLTGKTRSPFLIQAVRRSLLLRFGEQDFWALMGSAPALRKEVLADMSQRQQTYQVEALHREKLVSLGTLAAGLMHELHNPGAAAKRAASQLRQNLMRLQDLSLRSSARPKTPEQLECMHRLLEHAVRGCHAPSLSSVAQSDAEEALSQWLEAIGVENAFTIGPALVAIGFDREQLACAGKAFDAASFSDALNWLEALVSSVSLVCAIEESVGRVSELVMAVKTFAYGEGAADTDLDVHDSLQSTLTLLGHKLRLKEISVNKRFSASPSVIRTRGSALSQVWTNLIDNAADASEPGGEIEIATWTEAEDGRSWLTVGITDHGAGIAPEALPHIFEPFFTTKPQGAGTGLGLEIVHRIVTQKFDGRIDVESQPGRTRFVVRLPLGSAAMSLPSAASVPDLE